MRRTVHKQKGTARDINSDQAKGRVKEAAGDLTGNDKLKNEGKADQAAGDAKKFVNDVADRAEELVEKVKGAVHKDSRPHPAGRPGSVPVNRQRPGWAWTQSRRRMALPTSWPTRPALRSRTKACRPPLVETPRVRGGSAGRT